MTQSSHVPIILDIGSSKSSDRTTWPINRLDLGSLAGRISNDGSVVSVTQSAFAEDVQETAKLLARPINALLVTGTQGWLASMQQKMHRQLGLLKVPRRGRVWVVLDFECVPLNTNTPYDPIDLYAQRVIVQYIRAVKLWNPDAMVGVYPYPNRFNPGDYEPTNTVLSEAQRYNRRLNWLWKAVDFAVIDVYPHCLIDDAKFAARVPGYLSVAFVRRFLSNYIAEANRLTGGKPIACYTSLWYVDTGGMPWEGQPATGDALASQLAWPTECGLTAKDRIVPWGVCDTDAHLAMYQAMMPACAGVLGVTWKTTDVVGQG